MDAAQIFARPLKIRYVRIEGAQRTRASLVEDELRDGGAYDAETVAEVSTGLVKGTEGLQALGVFSSVQVVCDNVEGEPGLTDVTVHVRERGVASAKAETYVDGSGEGGVEGELALRNALGGAELLAATASYGSAKSGSVAVKASKPRFWGTPFTASLAATSGESRHSRSSCVELKHRVEATVATKSGANRLTMRAALRDVLPSRDESNPYKYAASAEIVAAAMPSTKCSVAYQSTLHDSLNNSAAPSDGAKIGLDVEWAGVGGMGDVSFLKGDVAARAYTAIADRVALGVAARAGVMCPLAGTSSHFSDRFFLGGPLTLRGFQRRGAGPRAAAHPDGDARAPDVLGGDVVWNASASVAFPLGGGLLDAIGARGHVFANAGNLAAWGTPPGKVFGDLRASVGCGVVFPTPAGRIEANITRVLRAGKHDETSRFQLGIGMNFF